MYTCIYIYIYMFLIDVPARLVVKLMLEFVNFQIEFVILR